MAQLIILLDNVRSTANVGSILRTADAAGVKAVIATGITPYPRLPNDGRDPVVSGRHTRQIAKTALGAERSVTVEYISDPLVAIARLRAEHRIVYGLEQSPKATNLLAAALTTPAALIVGSEVDGVSQAVLEACDEVLAIPQAGQKESLNVAVATGIAVYHFFNLP
jgi:23S rRNA (guanosine2251-2'-O)-methyltransferase